MLPHSIAHNRSKLKWYLCSSHLPHRYWNIMLKYKWKINMLVSVMWLSELDVVWLFLTLLQSSYPSWMTLLHFIPPAPVAKCLQQLDEGVITTPPKSGNQTGVADLYAVYTITLRRYKNQIVVFLRKQPVHLNSFSSIFSSISSNHSLVPTATPWYSQQLITLFFTEILVDKPTAAALLTRVNLYFR